MNFFIINLTKSIARNKIKNPKEILELLNVELSIVIL
jgi:hypothetical protein